MFYKLLYDESWLAEINIKKLDIDLKLRSDV